MAHFFNALHGAFSANVNNAIIYFKGRDSIYVDEDDDDEEVEEDDEGDKVGSAGVGSTRIVGYVKELKKKLEKALKKAKTHEQRAKLKSEITALDVNIRTIIASSRRSESSTIT